MRRAFVLLLFAACASAPSGGNDGGCRDAGANTVCGNPQPFDVKFAGLSFPDLDDGGNPLPNVLDVILADHDLSSGCKGDGSKLPAFTAVDIQVNGYFLPVDAGLYTSPTASLYEISWTDAGATLLGESDNTTVSLTAVSSTAAEGYFNAEIAVDTGGTTSLWGDFNATACQGIHRAIQPPP